MVILKKLNCLIICFTILYATLFTASQKVNAEIIKIGLIVEPGDTKVGVIVREDASTTSNKIANIADGITVTVIDSKKDICSPEQDEEKWYNSDTKKLWIWYQISYTSSNETFKGFVREDLIKVTEYNTDPTFEQQLADFPKSYHEDLIKLHAMYPNWIFRADKLNVTFDEAVSAQELSSRKQVSSQYVSWRSMEKGYYDWKTNTWQNVSNGGWYGASREVIAYYMDPRNFLNPNDIYVYLKQQYDSNSQNKAGVKYIAKNTFLEKGYNDPNDTAYGGSYINVIMEAAKKSLVSPYVLASTIIQEQGTEGTSSLISGEKFEYEGQVYKGLYNFFNFSASGANKNLVIKNGLNYAKSNGWTTRSKSIIDGAVKYGSEYIAIGQDTYFYKNYNVINPDKLWHQYAQNVADSLSSSRKLINMYSDKTDIALTFRIPVYKDNSLPKKVSPFPPQNEKKNNYYFNNIEVNGLTPSFSRYNYEYSLSVGADTGIFVQLPEGATLVSEDTFELIEGNNVIKLTVKAETGFKRNYIINVSASNPCKLNVSTDKNEIVVPEVKKGDTNGDNNITLSDLANVRLYLLGSFTLEGNDFIGADTNSDGQVTLSDLANIRLHLLGQVTLN